MSITSLILNEFLFVGLVGIFVSPRQKGLLEKRNFALLLKISLT